MRAKVYVAGPYTQGDTSANLHQALWTANRLLELGYAPYVPHLNFFWDLTYPQSYKVWMDLDRVWLRTCDVLYRIFGPSPGADEEELLAQSLYIPVVRTLEELEKWYETSQSGDTTRE